MRALCAANDYSPRPPVADDELDSGELSSALLFYLDEGLGLQLIDPFIEFSFPLLHQGHLFDAVVVLCKGDAPSGLAVIDLQEMNTELRPEGLGEFAWGQVARGDTEILGKLLRFEPSEFIEYTSQLPSLLEEKAICEPSCDHEE